MVLATELAATARVIGDGGERHATFWNHFCQVRDARVALTVAAEQVPALERIGRASPREKDRPLRDGELSKMLRDVYAVEPRPRSPRAEEVVRQWGTEEERAACAPEVVFGSQAPAGRALPPEQVEPAAEWPSMGDVVRQQKNIAVRYSTGIPTLDSLTRGGIQMGRTAVIVGRPGSGKTGLAIQVAMHMHDQSDELCVGLYMADEGLGPAVIRVAQQAGFSREMLEAADPETLRQAAVTLDKLERVFCLDPDSKGASLEVFLAGIVARAAGRPFIMVIDSAQVVRVENAKDKDRRVTTAMVAEAVKAEGRKRGAISFLLSQSNRASYKNKREADNSDPLSSGSESGAIEHMADVLLFLVPDGDEGRVKAQVPKNRIGKVQLTPFWLEWNAYRAVFTEVDSMAMSQELEAAKTEKETALIVGWEKKVLQTMAREGGAMSATQLSELSGLNAASVRKALLSLRDKGKVETETRTGRGGGWVWRRVP